MGRKNHKDKRKDKQIRDAIDRNMHDDYIFDLKDGRKQRASTFKSPRDYQRKYEQEDY